MKEWLLNLWNKIMTIYANKQIEKLREDTKEIYFQCDMYKEWYNILLLLWLATEKPECSIIYESAEEIIIEVNVDNEYLQFPVTLYKDTFKHIMNLPKKNKEIIYNQDTQKLSRYVLKRMLQSYEGDI